MGVVWPQKRAWLTKRGRGAKIFICPYILISEVGNFFLSSSSSLQSAIESFSFSSFFESN